MADQVTSTESNAIYHEVPPTITFLLRFCNVIMALMIVISFTMCLVEGHRNQTFYLLACNTVISALVGVVVNWWYRGGDLGSDKYWYIFIVAAVITFQCITTDVYLFKSTPTDDTNIHPASSNAFYIAHTRNSVFGLATPPDSQSLL
ncbi:hypothetical protein KP79_PYT06001 [Mizuhopecten yessoensis]|uniref:Uncharacterized protein n=1 Tax=Mizuhopecten yessoensis TaxID=6573 RepID=A0A210PMT5_MIZYE|nr:hypothetical protein KP79_PYT06001 [Mizuhopecten yessoensis]